MSLTRRPIGRKDRFQRIAGGNSEQRGNRVPQSQSLQQQDEWQLEEYADNVSLSSKRVLSSNRDACHKLTKSIVMFVAVVTLLSVLYVLIHGRGSSKVLVGGQNVQNGNNDDDENHGMSKSQRNKKHNKKQKKQQQGSQSQQSLTTTAKTIKQPSPYPFANLFEQKQQSQFDHQASAEQTKKQMQQFIQQSNLVKSCKKVLLQKGYFYDYLLDLGNLKLLSKVLEYEDKNNKNIAVHQYLRAVDLTQIIHHIDIQRKRKEKGRSKGQQKLLKNPKHNHDLDQEEQGIQSGQDLSEQALTSSRKKSNKKVKSQSITKFQVSQYEKLTAQEKPVSFQKDPCRSQSQFQLLDYLKNVRKENFNNLQSTYNISYHKKLKQIPFCIVVNSFMNAQNGLLYRNLDSIFMQNYSNYHVVYTDDNSPDNTLEVAQKYLKENNIGIGKNAKEKITWVKNQENRGAMANIFNSITKHCNKDKGQIVMLLDGDDSFIGEEVLSLYNAVYQQTGAALIYGQFITSFKNYVFDMGASKPYSQDIIQERIFRQQKQLYSSHLKTFYVDLFMKIKEEDMKYDDGEFYRGASDTAIMIPMLQIASPRIKYLNEIVYEYVFDTGLTAAVFNKKILERTLAKIFSSPVYKQLEDFDFVEDHLPSFQNSQ